jgi:predicted ATP-dependent endonuclease of OLD family
MQLLLTSHSTHIAAKLSLGNTATIYNDREQGRLAVHYVLSGLNDTATVHYLSKYLDATKSRMLFARKIILVEGIAEQLLIPKFFELHCGSTLEKQGCNVINVCGVAFKHFLKVIGAGFFVKCVVSTDRDTGTATRGRASALKEEFDQEDLIRVEITDTATFETDLIEANKSGPGKEILLDALRATRPRSGEKLARELGVGDIDVEDFYGQIKGYKSEFAFNLLGELEDVEDPEGFTVPGYIQRGFEFLE